MQEDNSNQERKLCSVCCSFYGTADTNFLCSKCFRESKAESDKGEAAKQAVATVVEIASPSRRAAKAEESAGNDVSGAPDEPLAKAGDEPMEEEEEKEPEKKV